jgi:hypothetical protein
MESDQQQCAFGQWLSSYPQSIPVDCSSTCSPFDFALSDLSSTTNSQTSSVHLKGFGLNIEMARSLWNSTGTSLGLGPVVHTLLRSTVTHICVDHMQLRHSPFSVQCPDIDARFAHDTTTPMSNLSRNSYSVIQEQFCHAPWRRTGELEPKDPTTGQSVLYALLEELTSGNKRPTSKCRLCYRVFTRADRAITHLRHIHLDHRPFWCAGACGTKGWCDAFRYVSLGPT